MSRDGDAQDVPLCKDAAFPVVLYELEKVVIVATMTITVLSCAGFADYGVNVNPSKTRLSFEMVTSSGTQLKVTYRHNRQFSRRN